MQNMELEIPGQKSEFQKIILALTLVLSFLLAGIIQIEPQINPQINLMTAYGQTKEKISLSQDFQRDPFLLPSGVRLLSKSEPVLDKFGTKPIDVSPLPLKVKAILISDHIRLASIDRYIVTVGDSIYDEKVLEIKADQVTLGKGDKKRTIFLDQSPIKLTVERQGEKR